MIVRRECKYHNPLMSKVDDRGVFSGGYLACRASVDAMTKTELLHELHVEREVIIHALNFSYIVGAGGWRSQFREFTVSPGIIDLNLDSSTLDYVIPRPADLIHLYDAGTLNSASVNFGSPHAPQPRLRHE